jgi:hypothetical protein
LEPIFKTEFGRLGGNNLNPASRNQRRYPANGINNGGRAKLISTPFTEQKMNA